jgi:hypothetical protein
MHFLWIKIRAPNSGIQTFLNMHTRVQGPGGRVSDPHCFNADPDMDPDPAFFLIADPDSGSGSLGLHNGRPSYRRSLQPSKEKKHENSGLFFYFCGSFLPSWLRIQIQQLKLMRIHADPDPKPCQGGHSILTFVPIMVQVGNGAPSRPIDPHQSKAGFKSRIRISIKVKSEEL